MKRAKTKQEALNTVRSVLRSTGFDEEEHEGDRLLFSSREEGDVLEGRADPGLVRFAQDKAKEIETAVPGSRALVEVVDEWVSIDVTLPTKPSRSQGALKVGDTVEAPGGLGGVAIGTVARIDDEGSRGLHAQVRFDSGIHVHYPVSQLKKTRKRPTTSAPQQPPPQKERHTLQPGDEVDYTNFTVGGSYKGRAVVTWDHGKSVEARTLPAGERIRLERASDGSLRRFT